MNSNLSNKRLLKTLHEDHSNATENKSNRTQKGWNISETTMKKKSETRCGKKWVELSHFNLLMRPATCGIALQKQSKIKLNKHLTIGDNIQKKIRDKNRQKLFSLMSPKKVDNHKRMQKTIDNTIADIKRKIENNSHIRCATSKKVVIDTHVSQRIEKTSNLQKNREENPNKNNRPSILKLPVENSNLEKTSNLQKNQKENPNKNNRPSILKLPAENSNLEKTSNLQKNQKENPNKNNRPSILKLPAENSNLEKTSNLQKNQKENPNKNNRPSILKLPAENSNLDKTSNLQKNQKENPNKNNRPSILKLPAENSNLEKTSNLQKNQKENPNKNNRPSILKLPAENSNLEKTSNLQKNEKENPNKNNRPSILKLLAENSNSEKTSTLQKIQEENPNKNNSSSILKLPAENSNLEKTSNLQKKQKENPNKSSRSSILKSLAENSNSEKTSTLQKIQEENPNKNNKSSILKLPTENSNMEKTSNLQKNRREILNKSNRSSILKLLAENSNSQKISHLLKKQEENPNKTNRSSIQKFPADSSNTVQRRIETNIITQKNIAKDISDTNDEQKKTDNKNKPNETPSTVVTYKLQKGKFNGKRSKVKSKSYVWKDLMATPNKPKWKDIMKSSSKFKVSISVMQILHDGELKLTAFASTKNMIEGYLAKHPNLLVQLINILEDTKSLAVCASAITALHQISVRSNVFNRNRNRTVDVMDYLKSSHNFVILINSVYTMNRKFGEIAKFYADKPDLFNKLFEIINVFSVAEECRKRVKRVAKQTALFMCVVLREQKEKDLIINLLTVFKLLCSAKRVCHYLSCKLFYDGLCSSYKLTKKLIAIVSILNLMAKHKLALQFMSQHANIISLLLEFVNYKSKAPISRTAVLTILQKIACTDAGLKILSKPANYTKLQSFFVKNQAGEEIDCRIKAYSILSLCSNKSVLTLVKLSQNLNLQDSTIKCMEYTKDLCDSDPDDESDDNSSNTDDSDEDSSLRLSDPSRRMPAEVIEPLSEMKVFFREYFHNTSTLKVSEFRIFNRIGSFTDKKTIERRVRRLSNSNRLAFPDAAMLMATPENHLNSVHRFPTEYLLNKLKPKEDSSRIFYASQVVYNLDALYKTKEPIDIPELNTFVPPSPDIEHSDVLKFESRFESGNLRRAIRVDKLEYDLILSPDTSTSKGYQWFYFQVSNMSAKEKYTFNIINFTKSKHLYNDGMQPLCFSAANYKLTGVGWKRAGERVVYYGNQYTNKSGKVQYKTLSFSIKFPYTCDYVYMAYHYPYTYTRLMVALSPFMTNRSKVIFARMDKLCNTVNNANEVPLLTITASLDSPTSLKIPFNKRPVIFITARVHPGETNASWIMEGLFNFLANDTDARAIAAREYFIFKLIPMLNPEGVIHGNTRRGLIGLDLNRCWDRPNKSMCPEIYYTKRLVEYIKKEVGQPIAAYIDIHGHSQEKCFFFYGCNPKQSWNSKDRKRNDLLDILQLIPQTIQKLNPNIQLSNCNYDVKKARESTGRVVMWRQFGINQSYTLECSYSEGYRKQSMNTRMLADIGESVVAAFGKIAEALYQSKKSLPAFGLDYGNMNNWNSQSVQVSPPAQMIVPNNDTLYLNNNQYVHYFFRF